MRARLFVISSLAVAAVIGSASGAHAIPQGPNKIEPKPTTTTTAPPKGPDQIAPKPTTTTTTPQGPGDIVNKPPKGDDPKPKGPGDLGQPKPGDGGGIVGPENDNGEGKGEYVPPADNGDTSVDNTAVDTSSQTPVNADDAVATPEAHTDSNHFPTLAVVVLAGGLGALLALFATRLRRDEADAEQV